MNRKIYYVDGYCEGEKERNIGFIKVEEQGLFIMLRGLPLRGEAVCKVYAGAENTKQKYVVDVPVSNGYGQARVSWSSSLKMQDCTQLYIPIDSKRCGRCIIEQEEQKPFFYQKSILQQASQENRVEKEQKPKLIIESLNDTMPLMEQDKWEQLCKNYPQVHIYPEADTIVIKPRDLVILTQEYHELATNSFVLHAFYNYRQLLLFRYRQEMESRYYLGVPGVYYEREKKIAYMFGFEGFENGESRLVNEDRRQVYAGCFGYYMKQVNI